MQEQIVYDRLKDTWGRSMFQSSWRVLGTRSTGIMCHSGITLWFGSLIYNRRDNIHLTLTLSDRRSTAAYEVTYEKRKHMYRWSRRTETYRTYCLDGHECREMPSYLKTKLRMFLANYDKCFMSAETEIIS